MPVSVSFFQGLFNIGLLVLYQVLYKKAPKFFTKMMFKIILFCNINTYSFNKTAMRPIWICKYSAYNVNVWRVPHIRQ